MMKCTLSMMLCAFSALGVKDKPITTVYLNGEATSVYFNDGDTFRILDGEWRRSYVRIEGFNTPEAYGAVHQWAENTAEYLFDVALEATLFAQNGTWHCTTDEDSDAYDRLLVTCDDLAEGMLSLGLAHAYSVDEKPARAEYLTQQKKAQSDHLGMWKSGVPEYIITSLHSSDEKYQKNNYNRLISAKDGHSKKWHHNDVYETCETVCLEDGISCMVYVPFKLRYGTDKAGCLYGSPKK